MIKLLVYLRKINNFNKKYKFKKENLFKRISFKLKKVF